MPRKISAKKTKTVWAKLFMSIPEEVRYYCSQLVAEGDTRTEIILIDLAKKADELME